MILSAIVSSLLLPPGMQLMQGHLVNDSRLLIKVSRDVGPAQLKGINSASGATLVRWFPQISWEIVKVSPENLLLTRQRFMAQPGVERADFDTARRCAYVPNDPLWNQEWHLRNIKADAAWDISLGSNLSVVAVMDTGIQVSHPDLAANIWTNTEEIPGNGIDDDGNGYVDDVHGYDFAYGDPDPDDQFGHGTACAGIVGAVGDNGIGLSGVAPRTRIAAIKAARDDGYFFDSANVPAFLYCADNGINVISMSFFSDQVTPAERDAVDYCWNHNVVLVAAAGNADSVYPYYPGAYDHVISVAALNGSNNKSWFSDFGTWVSVAAPGEGLTTTTTGSGYTDGFAGTSGACPHVAGAAGLLKGAVPSATNADIRAAIEDTSLVLNQPPFGRYTKYGMIDCQAALQRLQGMTSGSKSAVLQFVEPIGAPSKLSAIPAKFTKTEFGGLGFEAPNSVEVKFNGKRVGISSQSRNSVMANLVYETNGTAEIFVNGVSKGTIAIQKSQDYIYAPTDAATNSSDGPVLTGGFFELYRNDGQTVNCTAANNTIYVELPFRRIGINNFVRLEIEITRSYQHAAGGSETIYLYDWSSWSFPYASFIPIGTATITNSSPFSSSYVITMDAMRYFDPEGTIYAMLQTTGVQSNATISIDSFRLKLR